MLNTEYLKKRRGQERLRLVDLAEKLGYRSVNGFWRLEQGLTRPRLEHLMKLSQVFQEPWENFVQE